MADVAVDRDNVTAANTQQANRWVQRFEAAESILPGQFYYLVNRQATLGSKAAQASADVYAMALNRADAGDWVLGVRLGPVDLGVTLTDGLAYYLSTSGNFGPYADLVTSDWITLVGHGNDDGNLNLSIVAQENQL